MEPSPVSRLWKGSNVRTSSHSHLATTGVLGIAKPSAIQSALDDIEGVEWVIIVGGELRSVVLVRRHAGADGGLPVLLDCEATLLQAQSAVCLGENGPSTSACSCP